MRQIVSFASNLSPILFTYRYSVIQVNILIRNDILIPNKTWSNKSYIVTSLQKYRFNKNPALSCCIINTDISYNKYIDFDMCELRVS